MPRFLLHEFITGGGLWSWNRSPHDCGLFAEGQAMADALAADLAALPGASIFRLHDSRLPAPLARPGQHLRPVTSPADELRLFIEHASAADAVFLIAPESQGALLERTRWAVTAGAKVLGASPEFVARAADKDATARSLLAAGVPAPRGIVCQPGAPPPKLLGDFPLVAKPLARCGSEGVRLLATPAALADALQRAAEPLRIERFHPGLPCSVAVLSGPQQSLFLPPCLQTLAPDGCFSYLGGELPLPPPLAARAEALARRAAAALPVALGYWGLDLVLGDDPSGAADVVIEINPRLTTSYLGLRALCAGNLAAALLALAQGQSAQLEFRAGWVQFTADGKISRGSAGDFALRPFT